MKRLSCARSIAAVVAGQRDSSWLVLDLVRVEVVGVLVEVLVKLVRELLAAEPS